MAVSYTISGMNWASTILRFAAFVISLMLPVFSAASAEPLKVAVFDFELLDTSLSGELNGPRADEQRRLKTAAEQMRKGLADSGRYAILDIAPVDAAAHASNLQACGGCDVEFARRVGADLAVTGMVQKVSELILNMNIYLRDAHTGQLVAAASADFRSNTDESWSRTLSYLLRNRLLAPDFGAQR
jgi:Protein of unknown function (DUF2380)